MKNKMQFLNQSLTAFWHGNRAFMRGVGWLLSQPKFMLLLMLPVICSFMLIVVGWRWLPHIDNILLTRFLFERPESWYLVWFWWCVKWLYVLLVRVFVFLFAVLFMNILWVPIYEWISCGVEKHVTGQPVREISLWKSILLMKEEFKKLVFITAVSFLSLFIFNAFALFIAAFLMGWDVMDYPLARRGWSFNQRFTYVWRHRFRAIGMGLWLVIPFVQFFIYPLSVAGGSLLTVEALSAENRLTD